MPCGLPRPLPEARCARPGAAAVRGVFGGRCRGRQSPAGARWGRCSGHGQAAVGRKEGREGRMDGWGPWAAAVPAGARQLRDGEVSAFRRRPAGSLKLSNVENALRAVIRFRSAWLPGEGVCAPTRFCWFVEALLTIWWLCPVPLGIASFPRRCM